MIRLAQVAIRRPVATIVGALMIVLFGGVALTQIPIQLTPTIEAPQITVTSAWPGASPLEVEREIVLRQEEQLENLEGLARMESSSGDGMGIIELSFRLGTDLENALVRTANALQQVRDHPAEADRAVIEAVGSENSNIAWFMFQPIENGRFKGDVTTLGDLAEEVLKPRFERVPGVARASVIGARRPELQVWVDPAQLAARRLGLPQVVEALRRENRDWSAGDFDVGKRRFVVRATGAVRSPEDVAEISIPVTSGPPVRLGDVAEVTLAHAELREAGFYLGRPTVGISIQKKAGANVLQVMDDLRQTAAELGRSVLREEGLRLEQSYDETEYIDSAIALVRQSLLVGGALALLVLYLSLRSRSTTLVVAVAIPLSIIGTFGILWVTGHSLNVISLAGLAFAVGMVVDNSIVMLENIYRHRQMGKSRRRSALEGVQEVWGAVVASTLTTVAVFLPILFVPGEVGQLFRDLALAISGAVLLSLLVALTLIPSLSAMFLERTPRSGFRGSLAPRESRRQGGGYELEGRSREEGRRDERRDPYRKARRNDGAERRDGGRVSSPVMEPTGRITDSISHAVYRLCGGLGSRLAVVLGCTLVAVLGSWFLAPPAEYLPSGNRNFVFASIQPPSGYNVAEVARYQEPFVELLRPWAQARGAEARSLPGGGVRSFYFVAGPTYGVVGVRARDAERARELLPEMQRVSSQLPGAQVFLIQSSVFENTFAEGRNIEIDLSGPELPSLLDLGQKVLDGVGDALPAAQARAVPGLGLGNQEILLEPHRRRLAELGLTVEDLGLTTAGWVDGAWVGKFLHEGNEIDMRLRARGSNGPGGLRLEEAPLATPGGQLVTLGSVATVRRAQGPETIRRVDRQRTITVQVEPPEDLPLAVAMKRIEDHVLEPLRGAGFLGGSYRAHLAGSANQLEQVAGSMKWIFVLAVVLIFLLMAGLFESFIYPLVILWVIPLAALGGFLGLAVLRLFVHQGLDVLTMLGFVILVGTVVNNAILLVHQSLHHCREDEMSSRDAVTAATRNRVRPIFMSIGTSVFGMLPLVVVPGAGSELYRGLGSVVIGGLLLSTFLTLFVIPALLSLTLEGREGLMSQLRQSITYRPDDSSRYDLFAPPDSGSMASLDPSGTIDL